MSYPGWMFVPSAVLCFFRTIIGEDKPGSLKKPYVCLAIALPPVIFLTKGLISGTWITGVVKGPLGWGEIINPSSPWFIAFFTYMIGYCAIGLWLFYRKYMKSGSKTKYRKGVWVLSGGFVSLSGVVMWELGLPAIGIKFVPTMSPCIAMVWILCIYFAVVRRNLMALTPFAAAHEIIDTMNEGFLIIDINGKIKIANKNLGLLFKVKRKEFLDSSIEKFFEGGEKIAGEIISSVKLSGRAIFNEVTCLRNDGTHFPAQISASSLPPGSSGEDVEGAILLFQDITERKLTEEQLRYMAYHDQVTELPNRFLFFDRLEHEIERAKRYKAFLGLMIIDIDLFKEINDTYGHEAGDQLLRVAGQRLKRSVRKSDTTARIGGDEFALILPDLKKPEDVRVVEKRIFERFKEPVRIGSKELKITISAGIAIYPLHCETSDLLFKCADSALYSAKESGRNTACIFEPQMRPSLIDRFQMVERIREGIEKREFVLFYQPQVELNTRVVVGAEALVRWNDPQRGIISPYEFISVAEESGLIIPLGQYILEEACKEAVSWKEIGRGYVKVAVNVSARQLQKSDFSQTVRNILKKTGLEPSRLEIEVTETATMQNMEISVKTLKELREIGVRIAVDDFGTGYSSLLYLKRFPVSTLKIGQTFIKDLKENSTEEEIVSAIIALAERLKLDLVIAEGVELNGQVKLLQSLNCRVIQGYYFAKPMAADKFREFLLSSPEPPQDKK